MPFRAAEKKTPLSVRKQLDDPGDFNASFTARYRLVRHRFQIAQPNLAFGGVNMASPLTLDPRPSFEPKIVSLYKSLFKVPHLLSDYAGKVES